MGLIIIEGPRATGKTSLAARLQSFYAEQDKKIVILKTPRTYDWMPAQFVSPINGMAAIIECMSQVQKHNDVDFVIDRFIGTEIVMRSADKTITREMEKTLYRLEEFTIEKIPNVLQIALYAEEEIRLARVPDRPKEIALDGAPVNDLWNNFYGNTKLPTTYIDAGISKEEVFLNAVAAIDRSIG